MAGTQQINSEFVEVLAALGAGQQRVTSEYLEVIALGVVPGTQRMTSEFVEVISSMLPAPPALSIATSPLALTVSWNAVSSATAYQVWMGTTSGGETLVATIPGTAYTASGLTAGTIYYFYVIAVTPNGNPQSAEISALALAKSPITQLSPCAEDGGCMLQYNGGANKRVVWSATAGLLSPLGDYTDASGNAYAYFSANEAGRFLLEGGAGAILLEGGAGYLMLEPSGSAAPTGTVVTITVQQYG